MNTMENTDENKCPIKLFDEMTLRPKDAPKTRLFLKPLKRPQSTCWYSKQPVGKNTVGNYAQYICQQSGISRRTNRCGRRTFVTRLYKAGFSLEEIRIFTGHKNLNESISPNF